MSTDTVKRGPGRPKNPPAPVNTNTRGILAKPDKPANCVELKYSTPVIFKQIIVLYKAYNTDNIDLVFSKNTVVIYGADHNEKSTIEVTFDCKNLDSYFCNESLRVRSRVSDLDIILSKLTKRHNEIRFLIKSNDKSILHIKALDADYDQKNCYEIPVILQPTSYIARPIENEEDYPINLKVGAKHFKQMVEHAEKISKTLTIQKQPNKQLQITSDKSNKVSWTSVYKNPAEIDLKSTIVGNDAFSVSVYIAFIKPFSKTSLGKDVFIAVDKEQRMCFKTMLDKRFSWTCTVKVFTMITSLRSTA